MFHSSILVASVSPYIFFHEMERRAPRERLQWFVTMFPIETAIDWWQIHTKNYENIPHIKGKRYVKPSTYLSKIIVFNHRHLKSLDFHVLFAESRTEPREAYRLPSSSTPVLDPSARIRASMARSFRMMGRTRREISRFHSISKNM